MRREDAVTPAGAARPPDSGTSLVGYLTRLVWWCLLPLTLLAGALAWDRVNTGRLAYEDRARSQARNFAAAVDQVLATRIAALEMLARSSQLRQTRGWDALYEAARGFRQSFGSHVILADADMRMLFNTRVPLGTALPVLPRPQGRAAGPNAVASGQPVVGDVVVSPQTQQSLVAIAVPARREDGTALALLALVETAVLQRQLDALQLPRGWAASLLDGQGQPIAHRAPAGADLDGAERFAAPSGLSGWSVVVEIPRSEYRALWLRAASALAAAVLGATLLGAIGGLLAGRRLGRAVAALAQPTPRPGRGGRIAEIEAARALLHAAREKQREAEVNLSASEERFQATFEQAAVGIALVAPDGRWLRVNQKLCDIVGYAPRELLALTFQDITHPDDLEADLDEVRRMLAREITTYSMEKRYLCKEGAEVWINLTVSLSWRGDGEPDCFISVIEDIQARRQAEQALRGSEQRLQLFIEHAPVALAMFDRDMRYLAVSRRWLTDYRLEGQALAGRSHYEVFPDIPPAWRDVHRRALGGEVLQSDEDMFRREDGSVRWQRWVVQPWHRGDGSVGGILILTEDVSARVQAEQALHEQQAAALEAQRNARLAALNLAEDAVAERARAEAANAALRASQAQLRKLAQAVEQGSESIIITDVDGHIEYVNEAFVRQTGYAREEVLGRNPRLLQSGRTPREDFHELWQALTAGRTWRGSFLNRRRDGSEYIDSAVTMPLRDDAGRVTHYVSVQEDVTEKTRMAEELDAHRHHLEELVSRRTAELDQARAAAETASRAKSAFLANMSHEIRTPMNAILGLTHLLTREGPTPQQASRLSKIEGAARHLLSIINDILDLSKIEAGKLRLEERDFALQALLDHVRSIVGDSASAKSLAVEIDTDETPLWLRGDDTRVRQALLNYAGNAVKFTARGRITLRAKLLEQEDERVRVRFEVEDTGVGIEPAQLPRLFEAFEQADASTTRKHGGTGLGLAITRRLAALMDGEAGARSTLGQGSVFWFTAWLGRGQPLCSGTPQLAAAEAELRLHHAGARLLLAEDNFVNREVAQELLHGAGLEVDVAEDGREALEKLQRQHYDLVLMDVQMPVMDGLEATRALRARPEFAALPVLAMTANAFDEDRAACLAAGMDDFVAKPVDPESMYATLLKWLPGGRRAAAVPAAAPVVAEPAVPTAPPPAEAQGDLLARLALHPGVDVAAALSNLPGLEHRYESLLHVFAEHHGEDARKLQAHLARGEQRGAMLVAHSLKGVAATLGATELAAAARALETRLREEGTPLDTEALRPLVAELERALEPLVRLIRSAAVKPD
ncbi:PAS domain S-box protein [Azohydromonas australica]|uniref:PAS domain S-box protein n=1 Tax=Azohydromonas australica TaxID=364039 RepID=UPI000687F5A4|nr:PAS domain S-box protein [Azohydromonas australica]